MDKKVSIIIVNFKTLQLTINCIESIIDTIQSISYEIIVVDNASNDNSVEYIRQKYPEIRVVENEENFGFGKANNLGFTFAKGEFLFLLNSDTKVEEDPFPKIFNFMETHKDLSIGIIGTFLIDQQGKYVKSGGAFYSACKYLKLALFRYAYIPTMEEVDSSKEFVLVDYVIGADMFMAKKTFEKVNGFDEKIFMYFEDVELCKRIQSIGFQSYVLKAGKIVHYVKSSSSSQFARVYNTASLMYCLQKEMNRYTFHGFQVLYFLLKFPIIFTNMKNMKNNFEYISTIFNYKKYLNK